MGVLPLQGFTIGVTADRRWAEQANLLRRRGAAVLHGPSMATAYLGDDEALRQETEAVIASPPAWLLATTGIGVRGWFEAAREWGVEEQLHAALAPARVLARGPKSAHAVEAVGLTVWKRAATERMADLVAILAEAGQAAGGVDGLGAAGKGGAVAGSRVAVQLYGTDSPGVRRALEELGAEVLEIGVYQWRNPPDEGPAVRLAAAAVAGRLQAVTFTAAPAVRSLLAIAARHGLEEALREALNTKVLAACVGPVCAEGAREVGVEAPLAPAVGRLGLLVRELTERLQADRPVLGLAGHQVVLQGCLAIVDGEPVRLGPRERDLLLALARRAGAIAARPWLLQRVWGDHARDSHVVEVTVGRVRDKLGPAGAAIEVVPGRGYRMVLAPAGA